MSENAMTNIDKTVENNQTKNLLKILPPQLNRHPTIFIVGCFCFITIRMVMMKSHTQGCRKLSGISIQHRNSEKKKPFSITTC